MSAAYEIPQKAISFCQTFVSQLLPHDLMFFCEVIKKSWRVRSQRKKKLLIFLPPLLLINRESILVTVILQNVPSGPSDHLTNDQNICWLGFLTLLICFVILNIFCFACDDPFRRSFKSTAPAIGLTGNDHQSGVSRRSSGKPILSES